MDTHETKLCINHLHLFLHCNYPKICNLCWMTAPPPTLHTMPATLLVSGLQFIRRLFQRWLLFERLEKVLEFGRLNIDLISDRAEQLRLFLYRGQALHGGLGYNASGIELPRQYKQALVRYDFDEIGRTFSERFGSCTWARHCDYKIGSYIPRRL